MPIPSILFSIGAAGLLLGIFALIEGNFAYAAWLLGGGVVLVVVALVLTGLKLEAEEATEAAQEEQGAETPQVGEDM